MAGVGTGMKRPPIIAITMKSTIAARMTTAV
jgi:hypothetical protein